MSLDGAWHQLCPKKILVAIKAIVMYTSCTSEQFGDDCEGKAKKKKFGRRRDDIHFWSLGYQLLKIH